MESGLVPHPFKIRWVLDCWELEVATCNNTTQMQFKNTQNNPRR